MLKKQRTTKEICKLAEPQTYTLHASGWAI